MKRIITILLFGLSINLYAQKIKYTGGEVYLVFKEAKTNKEVMNQPYGKILSIEYDTFYKSLDVLIQLQQGATGLILKHIKELDNNQGVLMQESSTGELYYVFNQIDKIGKMVITFSKSPSEGVIASYLIVNSSKE